MTFPSVLIAVSNTQTKPPRPTHSPKATCFCLSPSHSFPPVLATPRNVHSLGPSSRVHLYGFSSDLCRQTTGPGFASPSDWSPLSVVGTPTSPRGSPSSYPPTLGFPSLSRRCLGSRSLHPDQSPVPSSRSLIVIPTVHLSEPPDGTRPYHGSSDSRPESGVQ